MDGGKEKMKNEKIKKSKIPKAKCDKCGREYDFPSKVSEINCVCGAKVFKPVKIKIPKSVKKKNLKPVSKKGKKK